MGQGRNIANSGARELSIGDQQARSALAIAQGHAMARNNAVARVFCYISLLRAASCIPDGAKAVVAHPDVAVPQDFQATGGNQAAHLLPGCLSIQSGRSKPKGLWEYAPNANVRKLILGLFEATQDLPASYNKSDSAAETRRKTGAAGIKQVFQNCCQFVLDQHPLRLKSGEQVIIVDRPVVLIAWHLWTQGSIEAFTVAATGKNGRILKNRPVDVRDAPRTDLLRGALNEWTAADLTARTRDLSRMVHGAKSTVEEFGDQESFLRAYERAAAGGFPLSEAVLNEIERPFSSMPDWYER